jgi:hypothetical protein
MPTTLRRLLDRAYEAFAYYQQPAFLDASPLRNPEKILKQLTAKPLRLLDVADVQEYASAALTTVGTIDDYKHFFPRLLDLAMESAVIAPPVIALKLRAAEWRAWPGNEQQVVEAVFVEACENAFRQHPDNYLADGWLVALAILKIDPSRQQAKLLKSSSDLCALQLAHVMLSDTLFASGPCERAYWEYVPDKIVQDTRFWMLSEEMRTFLLTARLRIGSNDAWLVEKAIARREQLLQQRLQ